MVSRPAPGSFVHVGHIGVDDKGSIEVSEDIDPGWAMMLQELQGYGVGEVIVRKDRGFVDGFWAGVKATSPSEQKIMSGTDRTWQLSTCKAVTEYIYLSGSNKSRKTIKRKPIVNLT